MDFINTLRNSPREHWISALQWLLTSLIGGLLPTWGLLLFLLLFSQPVFIENFTQHGEFALYSAAMLSATFYIVSKDYEPNPIQQVLRRLTGHEFPKNLKKPFPGRIVFIIICLMLLVISTLLFAGATLAALPKVGLPLNVEILNNVTVAIFIITLELSLSLIHI